MAETKATSKQGSTNTYQQQLVKIQGLKDPKLIKLSGTLTSSLQLRGEKQEPYYYSFVKLKGQSVDLPVIFKIKDLINKILEPNLKKAQN